MKRRGRLGDAQAIRTSLLLSSFPVTGKTVSSSTTGRREQTQESSTALMRRNRGNQVREKKEVRINESTDPKVVSDRNRLKTSFRIK